MSLDSSSKRESETPESVAATDRNFLTLLVVPESVVCAYCKQPYTAGHVCPQYNPKRWWRP